VDQDCQYCVCLASTCPALDDFLSGRHPPYAFYRGGVLKQHFVDVNEMVL
jgi:hypothetical protein